MKSDIALPFGFPDQIEWRSFRFVEHDHGIGKALTYVDLSRLYILATGSYGIDISS